MSGRRERTAVTAIARTELRAKLRRIRGDNRQLLATVFTVLFIPPIAILAGFGPITAFGRALSTPPLPLGQVGVAVAGVALTAAYLGGASVLNRGEMGRIEPLVRTATTPRAVVLGRAGGQLLHGSLYLVVIVVPLAALLFFGAGAVLAPALVLLGLVPVAVAGALAGGALAGVANLVGRHLGIDGWVRVLLGVVAVVAIFAASQAITRSAFGEGGGLPTTAVLPGTPLQAYGRLVLAPVGGAPDPVGFAVLAALGVGSVGSAATALTVERRLLVAEAGDDTGTTMARSGQVPAPFTWTASTRIGWRYLLRVRRNPSRLSHLFPLLFGLASFLTGVVTDPSLLLTLGPSATVVVGVILAGATFGLNPLGDEREQLPLLLSSARSTAVVLRGRAVAGCTVGLTLVLGVAMPLDLYANDAVGALARAACGLVLVPAAAGTALGLGAALPAFEQREYMNVDRAHPSLLLLVGYLGAGLVVTVVGLGLATWSSSHSPSLPVAVAWAVYLTLVVGPGALGYVYAVRRFDGFDLDSVS